MLEGVELGYFKHFHPCLAPAPCRTPERIHQAREKGTPSRALLQQVFGIRRDGGEDRPAPALLQTHRRGSTGTSPPTLASDCVLLPCSPSLSQPNPHLVGQFWSWSSDSFNFPHGLPDPRTNSRSKIHVVSLTSASPGELGIIIQL